MLLALFGMGITSFAIAQMAYPSVLASDGGSATAGTISLDWTLGEIAVETVYSADHMYTEGFQQPMIEVEELPVAYSFGLSVSPNPVTSILTLELNDYDEGNLDLYMTDLSGKKVLTQKIIRGSFDARIDVGQLASAIYILNVYSEREALIGSFKISKF